MNPSVIAKSLLAVLRSASLPFHTLVLMLTAALCAFLCASVLTLPAVIFNTPGDNACFLFSRILVLDQVSNVPLVFTGLASILALLLPLQPAWHHLASMMRPR
jgi:hypothetical protein